MIYMTLKELRQKTAKLPDDTILCCQSDSEGNEQSTCLDMFIDKVGFVHKEIYDGKEYVFIGGEDIDGIDQEEHKGRYLLIFQPSR